MAVAQISEETAGGWGKKSIDVATIRLAGQQIGYVGP